MCPAHHDSTESADPLVGSISAFFSISVKENQERTNGNRSSPARGET